MVPFVAISIIGLSFIRPENLSEFNPSGQSPRASAATLALLTMFAYLGLESATVPAGDVTDPARGPFPVRPFSACRSRRCSTCSGMTVVLGVVPREELVKSAAPFADAARISGAGWAQEIVGLAVMISSLGALNGWTLLMGQVPMAAAQDKLFPSLWSRLVAGCSGDRHHLLGRAGNGALADPGRGIVRVPGLLQPRRQSRDNDGGRALRVLRPGRRLDRGPRGGRRPGAETQRDRMDRLRLFPLFTLYGCGPTPVLYGFMRD